MAFLLRGRRVNWFGERSVSRNRGGSWFFCGDRRKAFLFALVGIFNGFLNRLVDRFFANDFHFGTVLGFLQSFDDHFLARIEAT